MTKTELGRMLEKKVNGWLKSAGWDTKLVEPKKIFIPDDKEKNNHSEQGEGKRKKARTGFWISKDQDIWGADILAIRKESVSLAIQVTADSGITKRVEEFSKHPFNDTWQTLLFQAKKKSGRWMFKVHTVFDGGHYLVTEDYLEGLFGKYFPEIKNKFHSSGE